MTLEEFIEALAVKHKNNPKKWILNHSLIISQDRQCPIIYLADEKSMRLCSACNKLNLDAKTALSIVYAADIDNENPIRNKLKEILFNDPE
jgi:hypothetical protein